MPTTSTETVQHACKYVAQQYRKRGGIFVQFIYDNLKVTDVSEDADHIPVVTFKFHTIHEIRNSSNMVHGGASSTMVALFSSLSLAADSNYWKSGSPTDEELAAFFEGMGRTRSIDVQITQAVPLDAEITVKCRVLSSTKSNAFIAVDILNPSGRLLVSGVHDIMKLRHPASLETDGPNMLQAVFRPSRL